MDYPPAKCECEGPELESAPGPFKEPSSSSSSSPTLVTANPPSVVATATRRNTPRGLNTEVTNYDSDPVNDVRPARNKTRKLTQAGILGGGSAGSDMSTQASFSASSRNFTLNVLNPSSEPVVSCRVWETYI